MTARNPRRARCRSQIPGSRVLLEAFFLGVLLLAGCGRDSGPPQNLILVVVDTLRADVLSSYGGEVATPNIDSIASRGVRFDHAYSHIPITGPSHASLFTGALPVDHRVETNAQILSEEVETLAERLRDQGYRTAGFVSLGVLARSWGFAQGFDTYDDTFRGDWFRSAGEINEAVLPWLAAAPAEPFFLWVHYSDPHEPFTPPDREYPGVVLSLDGAPVDLIRLDGHSRAVQVELTKTQHTLTFEWGEEESRKPNMACRGLRLVGEDAEAVRVELGAGWTKPGPVRPGPLKVATLPAEVSFVSSDAGSRDLRLRFLCHEEVTAENIHRLYGREVSYLDGQLGRLLEALESQGLLDRSVLVFTSDHGEGLGDHGLLHHIEQLYDSLLRVPLIVTAPGLPKGRVLPAPVSHVDVLPTVLDLLGLPQPTGLRGRDLVPALMGRERVGRHPILGMTFRPEASLDRQALRWGSYKYIRNLKDGGPEQELYRLDRDPEELVNLASSSAEVLVPLARLLEEELHHTPLGPDLEAPEDAVLSREDREKLEALGYVR